MKVNSKLKAGEETTTHPPSTRGGGYVNNHNQTLRAKDKLTSAKPRISDGERRTSAESHSSCIGLRQQTAVRAGGRPVITTGWDILKQAPFAG